MRANRKRLAVHRAVLEALEGRRLLSLTAPVYSSAGTNPVAVATGDFNGDGRSDVVAANNASNNVSVLLSNANGTLQPAQQFATGASPKSVMVGDVSGDGKLDVVTAGSGNVSVLLGNGNGSLQPALNVTLPPVIPPGYTGPTPLPQVPGSVVVGDLNADGKLDLVVNGGTRFFVPYVSPYGGTYDRPVFHNHINVLISNGGGSFAAANTYTHPATDLTLGDFNGDTKLDVLVSSSMMGFLAGNGDGTLQPPVASNWSSPSAVGDFDSDGKLDLVLAGDGWSVSFFKGQGNGTFQYVRDISVLGRIRSIVTGDVNGDGKLDLIVSTTKTTVESYDYYPYDNGRAETTEYTKVLLGKGDATFTRGVSTTIRSFPDWAWVFLPNATALGDLNADSRPDVVATDPRTGDIYVQLNEPGWIIPGTLSIGDAAVNEGNAGTVNANFTVTLAEAPTAANVTVQYKVVDGTKSEPIGPSAATVAGGDYVATSGTLTFIPGQTTKTITVVVNGDRVPEYWEYFTVWLSDATNADIIDPEGGGTIYDDEPTIKSFTGGTVTEGNSATVPLTFTLALSTPPEVPVTVSYATRDDTARGETDYVPVTGTLAFAPGETTQTFTVQVKGDLVAEYTEYFYVDVTGASGVGFAGIYPAQGTITDTDPNPTVSIADITRAEGPLGTQTKFEFVLALSARSGKDVSVRYTTSSGSASSSGSTRDYVPQVNTCTIYRGQLYASVTVDVIGDDRNESDETFKVNLSNPGECSITDGQAVGTILNDDGGRGKTWVGPASGGNWSTAGNWSPSGVPTANSLVHIAGASVTLASSVSVSELTLDNYATLTLAPDGGRVLRTSGFFMDYYYSMLNLNDNDMIIDYTAAAGTLSPLGGWNGWYYTGIAAMVALGSQYGVRYNEGIATGQPDALAGLTALGVGEARDILGLTGTQTALFSSQTIDATTVLVKYTYAGDANLDGIIDADDFFMIDSGYSSQAAGYGSGDFDYNGRIDADDYFLIDSNYSKAQTPLAAAGMFRPSVAHVVQTDEDDSADERLIQELN